MSWLRTVVANKVADHFRAVARVQHLIDQVKHQTAETDAQDAEASQQLLERREEVRMFWGRWLSRVGWLWNGSTLTGECSGDRGAIQCDGESCRIDSVSGPR